MARKCILVKRRATKTRRIWKTVPGKPKTGKKMKSAAKKAEYMLVYRTMFYQRKVSEDELFIYAFDDEDARRQVRNFVRRERRCGYCRPVSLVKVVSVYNG